MYLELLFKSSMKLLAANHLCSSSFCDRHSCCDIYQANSLLFQRVLLFHMEPLVILRALENQNKLF